MYTGCKTICKKWAKIAHFIGEMDVVGINLTKNRKNPFVLLETASLMLWLYAFLVCKYPDKAYNHFIHPFRISIRTKAKTPLALLTKIQGCAQ